MSCIDLIQNVTCAKHLRLVGTNNYNVESLLYFKECQDNYDKEFASNFEQFLDTDPVMSANNQDALGENFLNYIETHLKANNCPLPCLRVWSVGDL